METVGTVESTTEVGAVRGCRVGGFLLLLAVFHPLTAASRIVLFEGQERPTIAIPQRSTAEERWAAEELREHLSLATGTLWTIRAESQAPQATIHVGNTTAVGTAPVAEPESWSRRVHKDRLLLYGAAPRGTLYAVYRFLQDELGVRWWTPWDREVPPHPRIVVDDGFRKGRPAFAMRDIFDGLSDPRFAARSGLNGHFAHLPAALSPEWQFGSPGYTHTFYKWFPPDPVFELHPEWYSERGGERHPENGQLCLTDDGLRSALVRRLRTNIEAAALRAEEVGELPPRIYSVTQNDWKGPCDCSRCRRSDEVHGGRSGTLVEFVNAVAGEIAIEHPEILLETLAYGYTAAPPPTATVAGNVILRHSTLKRRDFARSLDHPRNRIHLNQLMDWSARAERLWVWDYAVHYGQHGDMPLGRLQRVQRDLRLYRELGVQGVYFQHDDPLADDLRDLSRWLLAQWMFDPGRSMKSMLREFTDGFYGAGARQVRRYLRLQRRALRRQQTPIRYLAAAEDYDAIDLSFLERAAAIWDAAEAAVAPGGREHQRIQHGRLTVDRATLVRYRAAPRDLAGRKIWTIAVDISKLQERYRATWEREIERRLPDDQWDPALRELYREIDWFFHGDLPGTPYVDSLGADD